MRARAHQSIDLQNTCFHSVPQAALNSSDLREQPWKAFIKKDAESSRHWVLDLQYYYV